MILAPTAPQHCIFHVKEHVKIKNKISTKTTDYSLLSNCYRYCSFQAIFLSRDCEYRTMNRSSPLGGTLEDAEFEPGTAAVTAELLVQQPCFPSSFPAPPPPLHVMVSFWGGATLDILSTE